jgi:phospholipase C
MIKGLFACIVGACVGLLAIASPAFADHGTIHDRVGDVKFNPPGRKADYDITRASWGVKDRRFIHTVSVRGSIGDPRSGFGPLPQLQIDVPRQRAAKGGCEYTVRAAGERGALSSRGCSAPSGAKRERGDGVSVKKVSRHTVKYKIAEDVIGKPSAYQWRFDLPAKACRRCVYDRIPNNHDKWHTLKREPPPMSPIKHVVIIYQENHSFDNVFGRYCVNTGTCDGATEGTLHNGETIPLGTSPDVVPDAGHRTKAQVSAIDGGKMDGFSSIGSCGPEHDYQCMTQYDPSQIPNLTRLASSFVISDHTYQTFSVPSFGAHIELVSASLGGFTGDPPGRKPDQPQGTGWGCDSHLDAPWRASPDGRLSLQPSCIPDYQLDPSSYPYGGAYRKTRVKPMPTIMDELDKAGLTWKLYTAAPGNGYLWAICPTFAGCQFTGDHSNQVPTARVVRNARDGTLPSFSVVLPTVRVSQHNEGSMRAGDNWIGQVVSAIENGPDWQSTAVFITYDDCGCFYDHVPPPPGLGIRTPMVIVSPYARAGTVDSSQASIASMLSFTEHTFGLAPLNENDANAYDYANSFDYNQTPLAPVPMTRSQLSPRAREVSKHPVEDPDGT